MRRNSKAADYENESAGAPGGLSKSPAPAPIVADRKDFNPLCIFSASSTNAEGVAEIEFKVKDNLTRYR
jgi:hypothetical protein